MVNNTIQGVGKARERRGTRRTPERKLHENRVSIGAFAKFMGSAIKRSAYFVAKKSEIFEYKET